MRPGWAKTFMGIAETWRQRSTCIRTQVGAVLVRDNYVIAAGYNGAPRKFKHCSDKPMPGFRQCIRQAQGVPSGERHELCYAVHAEQNVIVQAARFGVSTIGAIMYCTHQPCSVCAKLIVNAGIVKVVYKRSYPDTLGLDILREGGVEVMKYEE